MMVQLKVAGRPVFRGAEAAAKNFQKKLNAAFGHAGVIVASKAKTSPATLKRNLKELFGDSVAESVYGTRSAKPARRRKKSGSTAKRRAKRSASTGGRKPSAKRAKKSPSKRPSSKRSPKKRSVSKKPRAKRGVAAKRTSKRTAKRPAKKRSGGRKKASKAPGAIDLTIREPVERVRVPELGTLDIETPKPDTTKRRTQRQRVLDDVRGFRSSARAAAKVKLGELGAVEARKCSTAKAKAKTVCDAGVARQRSRSVRAREVLLALERERRAAGLAGVRALPKATLSPAQLAARRRGGVKLAERKQFAVADAVAEGVDVKFARSFVVRAIAKEKADRAVGGHTTAAEFIQHAWAESGREARAARDDEHEDAGAAEMARRQRELEDEIPF